jgi:prevent-host-death family protein
MQQFNIAEAKAHLSELVQKAMMGEEIVIARDNKPLAMLVPIQRPTGKTCSRFGQGANPLHGGKLRRDPGGVRGLHRVIALLDTNAFLRWVEGDDKLSTRAKSCIANPDNEILVSVVVAWELAIKSGQGGIKLALPVGRYVASHIEANGFRLLGIELDDVAAIETLPLHHRDPFDRLLVAQARNRKLPVVSSDRAFSDYGVKRIW